MSDAVIFLDRIHFAMNILFHYLFPQLTMGLAVILLYFKTMALRRNDPRYHRAFRFWLHIFGINFVFGVVTGIPMEFLFGTNWAGFSRKTGGVIGNTLAMEGLFAFMMESAFLGLLMFGEKRLHPWAHWFAAFMVFLGTWLSGFFILATNAWMQHPVAYSIAEDGKFVLDSLWGLLTNPWLFWQYLHNMNATLITASFVVASIGSFYLLSGTHVKSARLFVRTGVVIAAVTTVLQITPFGHGEAIQVFEHKPAQAAAMEGLFHTEKGAGMVLLGQPNMETQTLDNVVVIPYLDSLLVHFNPFAEIKGLDAFPKDEWPDSVPLVFYAYHTMILLGTAFAAVMALALFMLWRGSLFKARWMLWTLMLSAPLPYLATAAGWVTAETGRQPWLVYGLMRTAEGASPHVSSGNVMLTLLGFLAMYVGMGFLYVILMFRVIGDGPEPNETDAAEAIPLAPASEEAM